LLESILHPLAQQIIIHHSHQDELNIHKDRKVRSRFNFSSVSTSIDGHGDQRRRIRPYQGVSIRLLWLS
jgi:hypothetical protein